MNKRYTGFLLLMVSTMLAAEPAPWYWWASTTSDARVCSQTSPGPAWVREATAFRDARCETPKNPPPKQGGTF